LSALTSQVGPEDELRGSRETVYCNQSVTRIGEALTRRVVGDFEAGSLSERARARRWELLLRTFPKIDEMTVLDLGGDVRAWRLAGVRPKHLVLLNIFPQEIEEDWITAVVGDACDPPSGLPEPDLIYSNSVIEHVGGHARRLEFAEVVRSCERYWVQTPSRSFPIEPHFMFPMLQHLPRSLQMSAVAHWPVGNYSRVKDRREALRYLLDIELLSTDEMRFYFPNAELHRERAAGLTKSFIAIRR
jgi:hypothetical protein